MRWPGISTYCPLIRNDHFWTFQRVTSLKLVLHVQHCKVSQCNMGFCNKWLGKPREKSKFVLYSSFHYAVLKIPEKNPWTFLFFVRHGEYSFMSLCSLDSHGVSVQGCVGVCVCVSVGGCVLHDITGICTCCLGLLVFTRQYLKWRHSWSSPQWEC